MDSSSRRPIAPSLVLLLAGLIPATLAAQVTPDGTWSGTLETGTGGYTATYNVVPTEGPDFAYYDLVCQGTNGITCSVQSPQEMVRFMDHPVDVTFQTSSATGTQTVTLWVIGQQNSFQDSGSRTYTVNSSNQVPTASFTYSPTDPETDQTMTFTSTSSDPDGSIASCQWAFPGGGSASVCLC